MTWKAWEDDENTETDSFTVTNAVEESRGQGSNPVMFSYNCPEGSYGRPLFSPVFSLFLFSSDGLKILFQKRTNSPGFYKKFS